MSAHVYTHVYSQATHSAEATFHNQARNSDSSSLWLSRIDALPALWPRVPSTIQSNIAPNIPSTMADELGRLASADIHILPPMPLALADDAIRPLADDAIRPLTDDAIQPLADDAIRPLADDTIQPLADDSIRPLTDDAIQPLADDAIQPLADDAIRPLADDARPRHGLESEVPVGGTHTTGMVETTASSSLVPAGNEELNPHSGAADLQSLYTCLRMCLYMSLCMCLLTCLYTDV